MKNRILSCVALGLLLLVVPQGIAQTTTTAPAQPWGKEDEGLRLRVESVGDIAKGGKVVVKLSVKNVNERPVDWTGAFAWVFIAQSKEKAFYTEKVDLCGGEGGVKLLGGATEIAAETEVGAEVVLTGKKVFAYQQALKIVDGYPQQDTDIKPVGALQDVLTAGKAKARAMVYVPSKKTVLTSNTLDVVVGDADFSALTAEGKKQVVAELMTMYRRDAYAAMTAHDRSVKIGKELVPELLAGLKQKEPLPDFGEMWLVTALVDLGDLRAVPSLIDQLVNGQGGVKCVIAYHGPKLKSKALEEAIDDAAGKDATVAAWAARGSVAFGRGIRQDLIAKGMKSPDPQTRANLAEALVVQPNMAQITQLGALLQDDDPVVRGAVAETIAKANVRSTRLVGFMVEALSKPGDGGKAALCDALGKLSGREAAYDPKATDAEKAAVVKGWVNWWAGAAKGWK